MLVKVSAQLLLVKNLTIANAILTRKKAHVSHRIYCKKYDGVCNVSLVRSGANPA
jgi:hypothetical protein